MEKLNWKRLGAWALGLFSLYIGYVHISLFGVPFAGIILMLGGIATGGFGGTWKWFWTLIIWGVLISIAGIWYGFSMEPKLFFALLIGIPLAMLGAFIATRDHHGHAH